jgi:hypothetical protein
MEGCVMTDLRQAAQQALEKIADALPAYIDGVAAREYLAVIHKAMEQQPEQEPVAWILTDENINSIQVASVQRLIDRLKHAHHTDLCVRINGQDEWFQADWLKHMVRAAPPAAQPEQEPVAWTTMPKAADWDFVSGSKDPTGKLEGKWFPLYTAPPAAQRPWQGLTDDDWVEIGSRKNTVLDTFACGAAWAADQLEERNNG